MVTREKGRGLPDERKQNKDAEKLGNINKERQNWVSGKGNMEEIIDRNESLLGCATLVRPIGLFLFSLGFEQGWKLRRGLSLGYHKRKKEDWKKKEIILVLRETIMGSFSLEEVCLLQEALPLNRKRERYDLFNESRFFFSVLVKTHLWGSLS